MSATTKIQWADSSANCVIGCTRISAGCRECYAFHDTPARVLRHRGIETWGEKGQRVLVKGFEKSMLAMNRNPWICEKGHAHPSVPSDKCGQRYFPDVFYKERGESVLCQSQEFHRRRIFCNSNSDIFDKRWPIETFAHFLDVQRRCPDVTLINCTKRPENFFTKLQRALEFVFHREGATDLFLWIEGWKTGENIPKNIILLTSVENQEQDWRIDELRKIPAACRGSSFEPLLSPIGFGGDGKLMDGISWAIIGCESGPRRRECKLEWIESLVEQGKSAGVAVFVKQVSINGKVSHDPAEWPEHLRVREWPKGL